MGRNSGQGPADDVRRESEAAAASAISDFGEATGVRQSQTPGAAMRVTAGRRRAALRSDHSNTPYAVARARPRHRQAMQVHLTEFPGLRAPRHVHDQSGSGVRRHEPHLRRTAPAATRRTTSATRSKGRERPYSGGGVGSSSATSLAGRHSGHYCRRATSSMSPSPHTGGSSKRQSHRLTTTVLAWAMSCARCRRGLTFHCALPVPTQQR